MPNYKKSRKIETAKGNYKPRKPEKYKGNKNDIVYRSSWELKFMEWCDLNSNVLLWSSEPFPIKYMSPKDNKIHNYWPDFLIKVKTKNGNVKTQLIEIKPYKQTLPPPKQQRKTKRFLNEALTFGINSAKWKSAIKVCDKKGWEFRILTEKDLGT